MNTSTRTRGKQATTPTKLKELDAVDLLNNDISTIAADGEKEVDHMDDNKVNDVEEQITSQESLDADFSEDDSDNSIVDLAGHTNARFMNILERMEMLERENEILKSRLSESEESQKKEADGKYESYEKEITDTRKLLDDMAQDKANLELDIARLDHDLKDCKIESGKNSNQVGKTEKDLSAAQDLLAAKERQNAELKREVKDLQKAFASITTENRKAIDERKKAYSDKDVYESENKKLRSEMLNLKGKFANECKKSDNLKKEVDMTRSTCQEEALKRVNCENKIATLTETLEFTKKIHGEQMMGKNNSTLEFSMETALQSRLAQAMEDMRAEHTAELQNTVEKLKYQYQNRLTEAESKITTLTENERTIKSKLKNTEITLSNLKRTKDTEIYSLKKEIESSKGDIDQLKSDYLSEKSEKESIKVDLQSRMAVWDEEKCVTAKEIKDLKETLEEKALSEQQMKTELNRFGKLICAAEGKHKMPSPELRSIKKAKKSKRRLSKAIQDSESFSGYTPQAKKPSLMEVSSKEKTSKDSEIGTPAKARKEECVIM